MDYTTAVLSANAPYVGSPEHRVYYSRTAAPTVEPLSLDEAVRQLQLAVGDDNAYIQSLISVARDVAENATGRALMSATWLAATCSFPSCNLFSLAVTPASSITSIKYYADGETTLTTLAPSNYIVTTAVSPAVIIFDEDFIAPALASRPDAVQITFMAGAATANLIPPSLKHALRILVRHFYDHPEMMATGTATELPIHLRDLLYQNRVSGWVA
jgi:uncharacterized phiE125 gp8 family phage protein